MSTAAAEAKEKTKRRPKARSAAIVLTAMEERLNCIMRDDTNEVHLRRMDELVDELKRALGNSKPEDEEA